MKDKIIYTEEKIKKQKIAEAAWNFHIRQANATVEEKYKVLLSLQELHLSFKRNKGEEILPLHFVWKLS
jgi:hypothetical protein